MKDTGGGGGGPSGGGGKGPGGKGGKKGPKPPEPPKLPDDPPGKPEKKVPQDIRDFVDCKGNSVTLGGGKVTWLDLPGGVEPEVTFEKDAAGAITVKVGIGFFSLTLPASVQGGKLNIDTTNVPGQIPGLGNPKKAIDDWVKKLNDWLAHNKKQIGEITVDDKGKATLTKVVQVGMVVPPDEKPGWGKKALVAVGTTVAVTAAGVGTYALVSNGDETPPVIIDGTDQPTDEPTDEPTGEPTDEPTGEPTDEPTGEPEAPPPTEEELEQALIGVQALPPGFQPTQIPDDVGEGPTGGLCNGPGEAELAPLAAKAARGFVSQTTGRFAGEVLLAYSSASFGMTAFEAIRAQGASCRGYEEQTGEGSTITVTHEEVPTEPRPGWDDALLYHETLTFQVGEGSVTSHRFIAFKLYEGTVLAFNATASTRAQARSLLNSVYPRAADKALRVLD